MLLRPLALLVLLVAIGCTESDPKNPDWLLRSGTSEQKKMYLSELAYSNEPTQADVIARFLDDQDPEIVASACFYLGYLNAREYIPTLVKFLAHTDSQVVNMAASGIGQMANASDAKYLNQLYPVLDHQFLLARMSAIEAIGSIGSAESVQILVDIFDSEAPAAKWQIISALGQIGDSRALPKLREFQSIVASMDHSVPNKGGVRGSVPHPDSFEYILEESIARIEGDI